MEDLSDKLEAVEVMVEVLDYTPHEIVEEIKEIEQNHSDRLTLCRYADILRSEFVKGGEPK